MEGNAANCNGLEGAKNPEVASALDPHMTGLSGLNYYPKVDTQMISSEEVKEGQGEESMGSKQNTNNEEVKTQTEISH